MKVAQRMTTSMDDQAAMENRQNYPRCFLIRDEKGNFVVDLPGRGRHEDALINQVWTHDLTRFGARRQQRFPNLEKRRQRSIYSFCYG